MKKTTFLLIGAALVVIAVMALVSASCHQEAPLAEPPVEKTAIEQTTLAPAERTEDTSIQQTLPDTGGIKLLPL